MLRWIGALLREQWILAALLGLVWCGDMLVVIGDGGREPLVVPVALTAMGLLALVGRRYPVVSGCCGALVVLLNSAAVQALDLRVGDVGLLPVLDSVYATENFAGLLLVLYLFRRARIPHALVVSAVLVVCVLFALFVRGHAGVNGIDPLTLGFVQLILAGGTGLYLRTVGNAAPGFGEVATGSTAALLSRQWPVIAGLCVLLFLQMISLSMSLPGQLVVLLGCGFLAVFAVLSPMHPVETATLGAVALAGMALLLRLLGQQVAGGVLGAIPLPAIAAGMVLVSFAARLADRNRALRASGTLVAAALFALFMIPGEVSLRSPQRAAEPLLLGGVLLVVAVGSGMYFRGRDGERAASVRAAVSRAQQDERMVLARELHDIVAHHVTGIVVQAQAARMVADRDPRAASGALDSIEESGGEALTAMRRLVASMRDAQPLGSPEEQATTNLAADLRMTVDNVRRQDSAPRVDLDVALPGDVPPEISRSVLRVVQEALTNAEKHAADVTHVAVEVRCADNALHVCVTDDGTAVRSRPAGGSGGYGLVGMRERVEVLGGELAVGQAARGGWFVRATLPVTERSAGEV